MDLFHSRDLPLFVLVCLCMCAYICVFQCASANVRLSLLAFELILLLTNATIIITASSNILEGVTVRISMFFELTDQKRYFTSSR